MTIKPVVVASKRGAANDGGDSNNKKESQSGLGEQHAVGHGHGRQSPLQRRDLLDDYTRGLRGSPHKRLRFSSSRSKRRDYEHAHSHAHSHKRAERAEKHSNSASLARYIGGGVMATSSSPNSPTHSSGSSPEQTHAHHALAHGHAKLPQVLVLRAARKAAEEQLSGYNSGDEHLQAAHDAVPAEEWHRRGHEFEELMKTQGYELKRVEEDGACLFRSISLQIYGDEDMHDVVRQSTMNYIYENRDYFGQFLTEDINSYVKRKRRKESHGNHIELQAMSEIYSRPIEVYSYGDTPMNIFNEGQRNNGYPPLRLSYERGSHYNAIIDPYNATVGVGLGLAGYKPQHQTMEAMQLSEQMEIEKTMLEDKLKTTDWEATNEEIEEQVARESYQQYCREVLNRARGANATTTTATVTSTQATLTDSGPSPSKIHVKPAAALPNEPSAVTVAALTAKALNQFSHNQNMEHGAGSLAAGYDSDGTDISSTSSASLCAGSKSPNSAANQLNKRSKSRRKHGAAFRVKNKRRCDDLLERKPEHSLETGAPLRKSPKRDSVEEAVDLEQQPCTSKQSNSPQKLPNETKAATPPKSDKESSEKASIYEELLAATYATDDFNESDMLQRAIQLSTQDYFAEQRKYYCGK